MGPLATMFAELQRQRFGEQPPPRPHGGMGEQESAFRPRQGQQPMPFRDPQQAGPEPPIDPRILARLFGDR
jgi:hypothetical protein